MYCFHTFHVLKSSLTFNTIKLMCPTETRYPPRTAAFHYMFFYSQEPQCILVFTNNNYYEKMGTFLNNN